MRNESGRKGGRAARRARRDTPLEEHIKPVRPGMIGGRYQPLSEQERERIHQAALTVLWEIGLSGAIPSCVDLVVGKGGQLRNDRLCFPPALVEDTVAQAARDIVLYGQDERHNMTLSGGRVYFGTAGAAVHLVDSKSGAYRDSTLQDLYDAARVVDCLEHVHFFQRSMVATDIESPRDMDINTCYASLKGTAKHVGTSFVQPSHAYETARMLHLVAGGEARWRSKPFVSVSCCFVVPPLRFAEDACRVLEACVAAGFPVLLLAAGQAGATSPAALAGAVVQEVAEVLAGLVYVNLMQPGHPAIFGPWPFVSDLRTGQMTGGSGEQAVLMAACGQMGRYYDLPTGIAAGMADAKLPDVQSGYEKAYTDVLAGHSGANLIYEAAGMHASLLGCSLESYVIDNDMLGAINRTVRGIEVDDQTLSLDTIADVCIGGPSHYLEHRQTLELMQKDFLYPLVSDRRSPKEWREQGSPDIVQRAREVTSDLLQNHWPKHIPATVDDRIQEDFPVRRLKQRPE